MCYVNHHSLAMNPVMLLVVPLKEGGCQGAHVFSIPRLYTVAILLRVESEVGGH